MTTFHLFICDKVTYFVLFLYTHILIYYLFFLKKFFQEAYPLTSHKKYHRPYACGIFLPIQYAAIAALNSPMDNIEKNREEYEFHGLPGRLADRAEDSHDGIRKGPRIEKMTKRTQDKTK